MATHVIPLDNDTIDQATTWAADNMDHDLDSMASDITDLQTAVSGTLTSSNLFDETSDLDGKSTAQKGAMVPDGNVVSEIVDILTGGSSKTKTRSATNSNVYIYASDFGLTTFENGTTLTFTLSGTASQATLYSKKTDGTTSNLGYLYNGTAKTITVASADIKSYYAYSSKQKTLTCVIPSSGGLVDNVQNLNSTVGDLQNAVDGINNILVEQQVNLRRTINMASSDRRIEITPKQGGFEVGDTVSFYLGDGLSSYQCRLYKFYDDGTYTLLQTATKQEWDNIEVTVPEGKTFSKFKFKFLGLTEVSNPTITVTVTRAGDIDARLDKMQSQIDSATPTGVKAVILGDSYAQMGYWVSALKKIIDFSQVNNFGIGGANLKDLYNYNNYSYTDRPYQGKVMANGDEYNYNVINCQLEWLKRLVNDQCRGVYYQIAFTTATSSGSVALTIGESTYTASIDSGDSGSTIAGKVAALSIEGYTLVHPTGKNYVTLEASDPEETEMCTISASGTTSTKTLLRNAESPLYQDGDYPDFVIVEAGKNDTPDTSSEVEAYMDDVITAQTGYVKNVGGSAHEGTAYIPTPKESVNRKTFCGELSYLVREIRSLFPKTVMIVVGPSSLKGGGQGIANEIKKDEQMRLSCRYLQIPYVSWIDDGLINRVVNYPSGSGTQDDPWVLDNSTFETSDMLHPNQRGGFKLALAVAQKIRELISYRTLIKDY